MALGGSKGRYRRLANTPSEIYSNDVQKQHAMALGGSKGCYRRFKTNHAMTLGGSKGRYRRFKTNHAMTLGGSKGRYRRLANTHSESFSNDISSEYYKCKIILILQRLQSGIWLVGSLTLYNQKSIVGLA
ncbi:hypothetical protein C5167_030416 [Papaver somniferum]|nr:hypothetical protein C5167_030416 [Papaver somniferum]